MKLIDSIINFQRVGAARYDNKSTTSRVQRVGRG